MSDAIASRDPVEIKVSSLIKEFGTGARAVDNVSFRIAPGEFFSLLGSSGCGKTTTLRCIAGLELPTSGSIEFSGVDVAQVAPHLRDCGMVFQNYALFPHMTVADNVAYGLMARRYRTADGWGKIKYLYQTVFSLLGQEDRGKVDEALGMVELSGYGDRKPQQLSGGQQQRVALARAWALRPDVLLLDEPTASLDPHAKREVEALMADFAASHGAAGPAHPVTMVFSSHNLGQVKRLASRVIYMEHGRLVADLPVHDFFNGPLPEAARLFVKGELV